MSVLVRLTAVLWLVLALTHPMYLLAGELAVLAVIAAGTARAAGYRPRFRPFRIPWRTT